MADLGSLPKETDAEPPMTTEQPHATSEECTPLAKQPLTPERFKFPKNSAIQLPEDAQQEFLREDLIAVDKCINKGELFEVGDWILHDGEILLLVALHIHTGGARPNTT